MGELGALFNPGMRHELEERRAKALRREEEGNARDGDYRIDLDSGVVTFTAEPEADADGATAAARADTDTDSVSATQADAGDAPTDASDAGDAPTDVSGAAATTTIIRRPEGKARRAERAGGRPRS